MVLALIKTLFFSQGQHTGYTQVSNRSPVDCERGSLSSSVSEADFDEKQLKLQEESNGFRISPRIISDATIGLSDGLTVPFALTAGLSALGDTKVVIYGGMAELIAGGISMGLGGYLGSKSEAEAHGAALSKTKSIVASDHDKAVSMVRSTFSKYDFPEQTINCMTANLLAEPGHMVDFLMRFHHQLTESDYAPSKAYTSGLTISLGYILGGLVPLTPYLFCTSIQQAFLISIVVMVVALFVFGWAKTSLIGEKDRWVCFKNGIQMTMLGGVAAGVAMGCVKAVGG